MSISDEIMKDIKMGEDPEGKEKKKEKAHKPQQDTPKTIVNEEPPVDTEHLERLSDEDVGAETYPAEKV